MFSEYSFMMMYFMCLKSCDDQYSEGKRIRNMLQYSYNECKTQTF